MTARPLVGRPQPQPRHQLVTFPHAGGAAGVHRGWQDRLGPSVQVWSAQYPGHSSRYAEPFADDCRTLAADIAAALAPRGGLPMTLFGHSFGALIAFEAAAELENRYGIIPAALVVSAALPPDEVSRSPVNSRQCQDELIAGLRLLGDSSAALDDAELLQLLLPVLRADLRLGENYRPAPVSTVRAPIVAFSGAGDHGARAADMAGWHRFTGAGFEAREFAGGHFFLHEESADAALTELAALLADPPAPAPESAVRQACR